jgi:hypothetical protein
MARTNTIQYSFFISISIQYSFPLRESYKKPVGTYGDIKKVRTDYRRKRHAMANPAIPAPARSVKGESGDFFVVATGVGATVVLTGAAVVTDSAGVPGGTRWKVHFVEISSTPGRLNASERAWAAAESWTLPVPVKLNTRLPVLVFTTCPEYCPVVSISILRTPSLPGLCTMT